MTTIEAKVVLAFMIAISPLAKAQAPMYYVWPSYNSAPANCQVSMDAQAPISECCNFATASNSKYQLPYDDIFDGSADQCRKFNIFVDTSRATVFPVAAHLVHHGNGTFTYEEGCLHNGVANCNSCDHTVVTAQPYGCYRAGNAPGQLWFIMVPLLPMYYVYPNLASAPNNCKAGGVGTQVPSSCCDLSAATNSQYQLPYRSIFDTSSTASNDQCVPFRIYASSVRHAGRDVAARLTHHGDGTFTYKEGCSNQNGVANCNSCGSSVVTAQPYGCYRANAEAGQLWLIMVPKRRIYFVYPTASSAFPAGGVDCTGSVGTKVDSSCCSMAATNSQYQLPYDDIFAFRTPDQCRGPFNVYGSANRSAGVAVGANLTDHGNGKFSYMEGCYSGTAMTCNACTDSVVNNQPYGCYRASSFPGQVWLIMALEPVATPTLLSFPNFPSLLTSAMTFTTTGAPPPATNFAASPMVGGVLLSFVLAQLLPAVFS